MDRQRQTDRWCSYWVEGLPLILSDTRAEKKHKNKRVIFEDFCGTIIQNAVSCRFIQLFPSLQEPESLTAFGQQVIVSKSTLLHTSWRLSLWDSESLLPPLTGFKIISWTSWSITGHDETVQSCSGDDGCSVLTSEPQLTTRLNGIVSCLVAAPAAAAVWQRSNLCLCLFHYEGKHKSPPRAPSLEL